MAQSAHRRSSAGYPQPGYNPGNRMPLATVILDQLHTFQQGIDRRFDDMEYVTIMARTLTLD